MLSKYFNRFVSLFSINPKLVSVFLLIINFVYFENKFFRNIVLLFVFDVCIYVLKRIIKKKRPIEYNSSLLHRLSGLGPDAYSFPSAHTFTAFQILPLAFKMFGFFGFIFLAYALLVGYSRIKLKHHFFIDVAAGFIMGTVAGLVNVLLIK